MTRSRAMAIAVTAVAIAVASGCASGDGGPSGAAPTEPAAARAQATPGPEQSRTQPASSPLHGKTVAIDPGHNGGNAQAPGKIGELVDDGRGGTKACNTTGTSTAGGYPEHEFNWDVANRLTGLLEDAGAVAVLSRDDNSGVGPCIDERGTFATRSGADALISIHANGSEDPASQGFHVIVADPPLNDAHGEPSRELAAAVVEALSESGRPVNEAYGADGISERPDLAGLNHAEVPAIIVECGEMRNPIEAAAMETADGRDEYAQALLAGLEAWADRA